jgi:hypothetical protein
MALKIVAASVAIASGIDLSWSDCGDADTVGQVTDLQPTTINLGKNQLKGTGVLSKDEDGGSFIFVAKAGPIPVLKGSGNLCEDTTINMPLGAGSVVFHAIDCPRAAGAIEIDLDINVLSEEVTNDLLKISLTAEGTTGDKLLCMDIGVQSAAAEVTMEGGNVDLAFEDCGDASTTGTIEDLQPRSLALGTQTTLAGSGTLTADFPAGDFTFDAKALGVTVLSDGGDVCAPKTIKLPLGLGTFDYKGNSCPIVAGPVTLDFDVSLSGAIPSQLARLDIDIKAAQTDGTQALCAIIHTSPGSVTV